MTGDLDRCLAVTDQRIATALAECGERLPQLEALHAKLADCPAAVVTLREDETLLLLMAVSAVIMGYHRERLLHLEVDE